MDDIKIFAKNEKELEAELWPEKVLSMDQIELFDI